MNAAAIDSGWITGRRWIGSLCWTFWNRAQFQEWKA